MYVGSHPGLPGRWEKRNKAIKGGQARLSNQRVLKEDQQRVCLGIIKRYKEGRKNIPAPKTVMLDDGKQGEGGGLPSAGLGA